MDNITEFDLASMHSKFQDIANKIHNDIQKTYLSDDKTERKFLEKYLAVNNGILTNIRKLRNLIALHEE